MVLSWMDADILNPAAAFDGILKPLECSIVKHFLLIIISQADIEIW